jgi:hypothetical protein
LYCGCPIVFKAHPQGIDHRPDYCPLIPVPRHGRLGDLDALFKQVTMDEHFSVLEAMYVQSLISNAPTIIPAEIISGNEIKIIDTKGKPNYDPKRRFIIPAEEG